RQDTVLYKTDHTVLRILVKFSWHIPDFPIYSDGTKPGTLHITPISQGGTHNPNNLRVLCHQCHTNKTTQETRTGKHKKKKLLHLPQQPHPGLTN
ncbi:HNH endonuclease, partial [Corynebacterium kefirresidentii]|nr:HNH endonuclease [Corynebacterium kefirresidentii]